MLTCILYVLFSLGLPFRESSIVSAAQPRPLFDLYDQSSAYLLAVSAEGLSTIKDSPSEASENIEHKVKFGDKVLRPPIAFSFTSADQNTSGTQLNAGNEENQNSTTEEVKEETQVYPQKHKEDEKYEQGGGKLHSAEQHEKQAESGDKKYDSEHSSEKSKKGHHKEQDHKKSYSDKGELEEEHHSDDDNFKEHEKGEDGKKIAKYSENGDYKKGHSTKGEHIIHKVDEYEKKHEFFDEDHDEGDFEKDGAYHEEHDHKKDKTEKGNHKKHDFYYDKHGKKGHSGKGISYHDDKGHKHEGGHKKHYEVYEDNRDKGGKDDGWKWTFKKTIGHKPQHKIQVPSHGAYFRVKIQESTKV